MTKLEKSVVETLIQNYDQQEKTIVSQLHFEHKHGPTIGGFREEVWKEVFEHIVPKKFVVEQSVFFIDSNGDISKEVDLAIIDEMYTPYIFRKGKLKFIPIEAVAVAVECKSTSATKESLKCWVDRIMKLKTSRKAIARMHNGIVVENNEGISTQTATRPILIYCHLQGVHPKDKERFDFVVSANKEKQKIEIDCNPAGATLKQYYRTLNHADDSIALNLINEGNEFINDGDYKNNFSIDEYRVFKDGKEISLLSFNFMLNQLLMLINNPMLFPHKAYVDMFNREGSLSEKAGVDNRKT